MGPVVRIAGVALLFGFVAAFIGYSVMRQYSDASGIALFVGCVGAIIGGIAGGVRELVADKRQGQ
jgi:hypothetical protein